MIQSSQRTPPRRTRPRTRTKPGPQVRARSNGLALLTGAAIVAVAAFAASGDRLVAAGGVASAPRSAVGSGATVAVPPSGGPATGAAIADVPWLAQAPDGDWVYGRGADTTPRRLPADETGLAISEQWVASVVPGADGRSTVRFRDRATGRRVADVAAPIWVSAGAWSNAGLVVTGYGDDSLATDGGLVLIAPETMVATVLLDAGPFDPRLGNPAARGEVVVSPSGRLVAANACGVELCDTQVVDVATGTVSRPIRAGAGFLRILTDEAIVTTDGDGRWISARRIADGAEAWRRTNSVLLDPVAAADGSVVAVMGSNRTGWGIVAIDADGEAHDLSPRTDGRTMPRIWTTLSGPSAIVAAAQPFVEGLGSGRTVPVTLFEFGAGVGSAHRRAASLHLPVASEWAR